MGVKKDEFFLQRKRATKNEVMSLLEGAGFSKSNPYFIVQQGKVNALCVMSDLERLNLLKEVAGTTVYDEKKKESLSKMEENQVHLAKTQESLEFMEQKLEELRGEKEELTKYQTLDRQRKAMAFTLYDKELKKARDTLKEIENARVEEMDSRRDMNVEMRNRAVEIANVEATQKAKTGSLRRNMTNLTGLEQVSNSPRIDDIYYSQIIAYLNSCMIPTASFIINCPIGQDQSIRGTNTLGSPMQGTRRNHQEYRVYA